LNVLQQTYVFLSKGGIMMIPLLLSSILALAIILERAFQLRRKKVVDPTLLRMIETIQEEEDIRALRRLCQETRTPFSRLIQTALENLDLPREELKELLEDEGRQEVRELERGLGALETVASAAPLMGLLGTVIGMIKVFNVISKIGVGQASALSGGISEALITTVVGLSIGIPALIAYNYYTHKAENLILDMEKSIVTFLQKLRKLETSPAATRQEIIRSDS
jgi:biopolymer transport protein ExbB